MQLPDLLERLTINALTAADSVVIPVTPAYLSLNPIEAVKERLNPRLRVLGILLTQFNQHTLHHRRSRSVSVPFTPPSSRNPSCFVRREQTPRVYLLSNDHVIAGENRGVKAADRILQPGSRTFVPAQSGRFLVVLDDVVDAAKADHQ